MTAHLLLAVVVAALSLSAALPLRGTRDTETAVDVNDVQLKLRFSLMAVDHVTQFLYRVSVVFNSHGLFRVRSRLSV